MDATKIWMMDDFTVSKSAANAVAIGFSFTVDSSNSAKISRGRDNTAGKGSLALPFFLLVLVPVKGVFTPDK